MFWLFNRIALFRPSAIAPGTYSWKPGSHYKNYAKILITSNELPISYDNTTGWHRRWLIIDFPNTFKPGIDILKSIPEEEYSNLSRRIMTILPELLTRGEFTGQGNFEDQRISYIKASNPFLQFKEEALIETDDMKNDFERYNDISMSFNRYLRKKKLRRMNYKQMKTCISDELVVDRVRRNGELETYVLGIKIKDEYRIVQKEDAEEEFKLEDVK